MASPEYDGLFEDWEIGLAKNVIKRFVKQWKCLDIEGFDDLLQECLTHWHFSKESYDPSTGANIRTFMSRVLEHKLQHIIEKLTTHKRKISSNCVSLDIQALDDDSLICSEWFSKEKSLDSDLSSYGAELKIDISQCTQQLTFRQQELCRLLSKEGLSIKEASEVLRIPRSTLYEDIKRIKAVFRNKNMGEYIK